MATGFSVVDALSKNSKKGVEVAAGFISRRHSGLVSLGGGLGLGGGEVAEH